MAFNLDPGGFHQPKPTIVHVDADADARLESLGMTFDGLNDVVAGGERARRQVGRYAPPMARGFVTYCLTTELLREWLIPWGWSLDDSQNFARTISPDRAMAIIVATGDESTGLPDFAPRTIRSKGPLTIEAVEVNEQLELFPEIFSAAAAPSKADRIDSWLLLVGRANMPEGGVAVRAELSRPREITREGCIMDWSERIILEEIAPPGKPARSVGPDLNDLSTAPKVEIDVPVIRRAEAK